MWLCFVVILGWVIIPTAISRVNALWHGSVLEIHGFLSRFMHSCGQRASSGK